MQICAAECFGAERHRGCVRASHLTRAGSPPCAACREGASSGRRAVARQQRRNLLLPQKQAGRRPGQRCSRAALGTLACQVFGGLFGDDGLSRLRPRTHATRCRLSALPAQRDSVSPSVALHVPEGREKKRDTFSPTHPLNIRAEKTSNSVKC
ncbi:hypothetical protein NDU88_005481 [Pleurodeles waltl]|uniref:Uncharacterized protein n=1 Tax=Pleurodeles waltl TaxID=8319 RepID=A0AAV7WUW6_PLEWA|nr:hypothetical protein NDU88_005481 [Pleurodeles waltl]